MNRWILCSLAAILCTGPAYAQAPPPNDTCAGAIELSCGVTYTIPTNTAFANDDYDQLGFCTGFTSSGPDIVYKIVLPDGATVNFTLNTNPPNGSGYDAALYLITDCANPSTTCLIGSDACNVMQEIEAISYTNDTGGPLTTFMIVDGFIPTPPEVSCGAPSGTGTLAGTVTCPPAPMGACCLSDTTGVTCMVITEADCDSLGGAYQGDGTDCDPDPCVVPTGACCNAPGAPDCFVTTRADCEADGGDYAGDGTNCTPPNPCPVPVEPSTWGKIKSIYRH